MFSNLFIFSFVANALNFFDIVAHDLFIVNVSPTVNFNVICIFLGLIGEQPVL